MKELLTYVAQNLVEHPEQVVDVNRLLKQYEMLQTMTKQFSGGKLPKNLRRMMGKKGAKGMMGGMGGGMPGGFPF